VNGGQPYIGRFAPSPSGPLHFGSLLAAVASYLDARSQAGKWLLRIEDIDPPRQQPGADADILATLDAYGFEWDGEVSYQRKQRARHLQCIDELQQRGLAYACDCSRRDLGDEPRSSLGIIYPGTCRTRTNLPTGDSAIRVRTHDDEIAFNDQLQGRYAQKLESESGDFVIHRRDDLIAYHLAVVVDDFDQQITHVVRGIDLLDSTPRQIHLQHLLDFSTPVYSHLPVAINRDGQKLSKLTGANPVRRDQVGETLYRTLQALRQEPPAALQSEATPAIWQWAIEHWHSAALVGFESIDAVAQGFA